MKVGFFSRRLVSYFCKPQDTALSVRVCHTGLSLVTLEPNKVLSKAGIRLEEHMAVTSGRSEKGFLE